MINDAFRFAAAKTLGGENVDLTQPVLIRSDLYAYFWIKVSKPPNRVLLTALHCNVVQFWQQLVALEMTETCETGTAIAIVVHRDGSWICLLEKSKFVHLTLAQTI